MQSSESSTLLVIPCYRESQRLPVFLPVLCTAISAMGDSPVSVRVVDDGSGDGEQQILSDLVAGLRESHPFLQEPLVLERNRGKGEGRLRRLGRGRENVTNLGFVDADGSVSAAEVVRVLRLIPGIGSDECLYAARLHDAKHSVKRTVVHKWLGLLFRRLTRLILRLPVRDTQCGFKFVPAASYRAVRGQLTENRYCFDIDLTIHLLKNGLKFAEVPISWSEIPGTRLNLSQAAKMLGSLWRLRKSTDLAVMFQ